VPTKIENVTVTAYDKDHNRLFILDTGTTGEILKIYSLKTAYVPNPDTGTCTRRTRRIAYFRTAENGYCFEIYFTRYGRQAGIRNYQARRPGDNPFLRIEGTAPIHTAPRVERHPNYGHWVLVIGEGNPYQIDVSPDHGVIIAEAIRCTRRESGWSGYQINEIYGPTRNLPDATMHTVHLAFKEAELHYNQ